MDPILVGKAVTTPEAARSVCCRQYGNRHGLVAGATGTGKTVTLMTLGRRLLPHRRAGVHRRREGRRRRPRRGRARRTTSCRQRVAQIGIAGLRAEGQPGRSSGTCTASSAIPCAPPSARSGPTLLGRILELNDTQAGVLEIVFKLADDHGWLLLDLDDLRALLNLVADNRKDISHAVRPGQHAVDRGDPARAAATRSSRAATRFFGEPALELADLMRTTT